MHARVTRVEPNTDYIERRITTMKYVYNVSVVNGCEVIVLEHEILVIVLDYQRLVCRWSRNSLVFVLSNKLAFYTTRTENNQHDYRFLATN